jgi:hypothetical protein
MSDCKSVVKNLGLVAVGTQTDLMITKAKLATDQ